MGESSSHKDGHLFLLLLWVHGKKKKKVSLAPLSLRVLALSSGMRAVIMTVWSYLPVALS